LAASAAAPCPKGLLLNVVDDDPAPRGEVLEFAEQLLREGRAGAGARGRQGGPEGSSSSGGASSGGSSTSSGGASSGGCSSSGSSSGGGGARSSGGSSGGGRSGGGSSGGAQPAPAPGSSIDPVGRGRGARGAGEDLEEKRVSNAKLKRELPGFQLQHPSYRDGLTAIAGGDLGPFTPADLAALGYRL